MDLELNDWLASTHDVTPNDAAELAAAGETILRTEPTLPPVLAAECHIRLASLWLLVGTHDVASRHAIHACTLAFDMPAESQLHVVPRAVALLRSAMVGGVDESPLAADVLDRAGATLTTAMETTIGAADHALGRLAALAVLVDRLDRSEGPVAAEAAGRARQAIARVALELETAGEQTLADEAMGLVTIDV